METPNKEGAFRYSYSAKEQEEVKRIREKYAPSEEKEENKLERLRRLDNRATSSAQIVSLVCGIVGTLILGFGMSLVMTELSSILGSLRDYAMGFGIAIGLVGGILASLAYPAYLYVLRKARKKIAPEILRLSDELMK